MDSAVAVRAVPVLLAPDVAKRLRRLPPRRRVLVGSELRRLADEPAPGGSRFPFARSPLGDVAACERVGLDREGAGAGREGCLLAYALLTSQGELGLLLGRELDAAWRGTLARRFLHGRLRPRPPDGRWHRP